MTKKEERESLAGLISMAIDFDHIPNVREHLEKATNALASGTELESARKCLWETLWTCIHGNTCSQQDLEIAAYRRAERLMKWI